MSTICLYTLWSESYPISSSQTRNMILATQEDACTQIWYPVTLAANPNFFQTFAAATTEKGAELTNFASFLAPSSDWLNATYTLPPCAKHHERQNASRYRKFEGRMMKNKASDGSALPRNKITSEQRTASDSSLLRIVWGLGIPLVPRSDSKPPDDADSGKVTPDDLKFVLMFGRVCRRS